MNAYETFQLGERLALASNPEREHPDYYLPADEDDEEVDTDSGEYIVATLKPADLIDHIDNLQRALERSCNRFYWLQLSALELARQAEQSLDYRPAFRKAIANVFLNGSEPQQAADGADAADALANLEQQA
jgi:hypothetical protein